ncbi:MAG: polysaccharide biosynthesis protein [Candidatus Nanopelagicales bacterium]
MKPQARMAVLALIDGLCWMFAVIVATLLRYDAAPPVATLATAAKLGFAAVVVHAVVGFALELYAGRYRLGSFGDLASLTLASLVPPLLMTAYLGYAYPRPLALSVPGIAWPLAIVAMGSARTLLRIVRDRNPRLAGDVRVPTIIFGAGEAAEQLVHSMKRSPASTHNPVALLDDDPSKSHRRIDGVRVRGTRTDLARVAGEYPGAQLVIAVPSADSSLIAELDREARRLNLPTSVLPPVPELLAGHATENQLREITEEDLLGRRPVDIDMSAIVGTIAGHVVLVTGAGGSIGSELCRQVARLSPRRLVMLDRDESALHAVQLSITGQALLADDDLELADIRDAERVREVFAATQPTVVFHAAALKHLSLLERYPEEAWKTNVLGTLNVLRAAAEVGVHTFINISTDKAANPQCVLGYSKRITERITAGVGRDAIGTFASVRFGNVLGSRGSMLGTFKSQVAAGGPVTVTHPDVARFFMTIPEAVTLVLQAAALADDGQVLILDMGEEVRIAEVAQRLIERSGRPGVEIKYTGLRPGEKLHEELLGEHEADIRPNHDLITQADVPRLDQDHVEGLGGSRGTSTMRALATATGMRPIVPRGGAPIPHSTVSLDGNPAWDWEPNMAMD